MAEMTRMAQLMSKRFLTLVEIAEYAGLDTTKIYRLSAAGLLPGKIKYGMRTIRVDRQEWDSVIDEAKATGQSVQDIIETRRSVTPAI